MYTDIVRSKSPLDKAIAFLMLEVIVKRFTNDRVHYFSSTQEILRRYLIPTDPELFSSSYFSPRKGMRNIMTES